MAALRAYSNTITLDGFFFSLTQSLQTSEGPRVLTNAWCDDENQRRQGRISPPNLPCPSLFLFSTSSTLNTVQSRTYNTTHNGHKVGLTALVRV